MDEAVLAVQRAGAGVRLADFEFHRPNPLCPEDTQGALQKRRADALAAAVAAHGDVLDVAQRTAVVRDAVGDDVAHDSAVFGDEKARFLEILLEGREGPGLRERRLLDAVNREQVGTLDGPNMQSLAGRSHRCHDLPYAPDVQRNTARR